MKPVVGDALGACRPGLDALALARPDQASDIERAHRATCRVGESDQEQLKSARQLCTPVTVHCYRDHPHRSNLPGESSPPHVVPPTCQSSVRGSAGATGTGCAIRAVWRNVLLHPRTTRPARLQRRGSMPWWTCRALLASRRLRFQLSQVARGGCGLAPAPTRRSRMRLPMPVYRCGQDPAHILGAFFEARVDHLLWNPTGLAGHGEAQHQ